MVKIYWGPEEEFEKIVLNDGINYDSSMSLTSLVIKFDSNLKKIHIQDTDNDEKPQKFHTLVAKTNEYSSISESGINNFNGLLNSFEIDNLYFQNPPSIVLDQLKNSFTDIKEIFYDYKKFTINELKEFYDTFDNNILGQDTVKYKFSSNLYPLVKGYNEKKPVIFLLYGPSGVGKTETAKFLAKISDNKLFRKQFSMFQTNAFVDYVFGSNHFGDSLARDLVSRKGNVILFDEFDKINPLFYSAFYQMFDEGCFVDKNYSINLSDCIIICTTNFLDRNKIKDALGEPILSRIDCVVEYGDLSNDVIEIIIKQKYENLLGNLSDDDRNILQNSDINKRLLQYSHTLKNVRDIDKFIKEYVYTDLLQNITIDN